MSEDDKRVLVNFLGQYWSLFETHCKESGDDAQQIYENLGGEAE